LPNDPTHEELKRVLQSKKAAVTLGPWRPTSRARAVEIRSALRAGNIVMQGVGLYLKCFEDRPDEMVSIGLTIETSIGPKCFARVDWRGTNHPNTHHLCGDLQFIDAGQTHFHNPALCPPGDDPMAHIRENLPIAVAIEARPPNFEALLDRCASILNVTNLTKATPPQWQSRILYP
jgi:hypothetical protein